ncbi:hypothetical protein GW17_00022725 [Ensete ventricosum]|nr:hypothetical protein GW17_00022725 [Ensete ventricosum]
MEGHARAVPRECRRRPTWRTHVARALPHQEGMGHSCNFDGIEFFATRRATHVRCHENADAAQRGTRTSPVLSLTHVTRHSPIVSYLNLRVSHLSADPFAWLGPVRDPHVQAWGTHVISMGSSFLRRGGPRTCGATRMLTPTTWRTHVARALPHPRNASLAQRVVFKPPCESPFSGSLCAARGMGHSCNFDGIEFFATWRATNVRCHENADAAQCGARTSPVLSLTHVTCHPPSVSYFNLRVSRLSADPFARLGPVRDPHVRTRAIRRRRKHERYGHLRKPKLHKFPFTRPDSRAQHMKDGPHQTTYKIRKP